MKYIACIEKSIENPTYESRSSPNFIDWRSQDYDSKGTT